jgi:hypothetical protein
MGRYLPGAILAAFGLIAYAIGCILFLHQRRQRAAAAARKSSAATDTEAASASGSTTLLVYAVAMMALGIAALGAGLYTLEILEIHTLGG